MNYFLLGLAMVAAILVMIYVGNWQDVKAKCAEGVVVRDYWSMPVCVPVDRNGENQ